MSPAQPVGDPLPGTGELPPQVAAPAPDGNERPFSVYLHVPYCRVRCGYCDFNTYTNLSMGRGASAEDFVGTLAGELRATRRAMDAAGLPVRRAQTVFVGGGTPTMLPAADLVSMLELVRECFGLAADAEVTTEANPDSVDEAGLAQGGVGHLVLGGLVVVLGHGQLPTADLPPHASALLDDQGVGAHVVRADAGHRIQ